MESNEWIFSQLTKNGIDAPRLPDKIETLVDQTPGRSIIDGPNMISARIEIPVEPTGKNHCFGDDCGQKAYSEDGCDCFCGTRCGPWNKYKRELADYREAQKPP